MVKRLGFVLAFAGGCVSSAGPFITNITTPSPGVLRVTRCMVDYSSPMGGAIATGDCSTQTLWLGGPPGATTDR